MHAFVCPKCNGAISRRLDHARNVLYDFARQAARAAPDRVQARIEPPMQELGFEVRPAYVPPQQAAGGEGGVTDKCVRADVSVLITKPDGTQEKTVIDITVGQPNVDWPLNGGAGQPAARGHYAAESEAGKSTSYTTKWNIPAADFYGFAIEPHGLIGPRGLEFVDKLAGIVSASRKARDAGVVKRSSTYGWVRRAAVGRLAAWQR